MVTHYQPKLITGTKTKDFCSFDWRISQLKSWKCGMFSTACIMTECSANQHGQPDVVGQSFHSDVRMLFMQ